jgi:hypothetical protein
VLPLSREGGAPTPTTTATRCAMWSAAASMASTRTPWPSQLAKTALWLEAYTPDRPLSFIDHHLRMGDALLGVLDPKVLENGIPDEAYTALSGDDKAVVTAIKKANRDALKAIPRRPSVAPPAEPGARRGGRARNAAALDALPDDTLGRARRQARRLCRNPKSK